MSKDAKRRSERLWSVCLGLLAGFLAPPVSAHATCSKVAGVLAQGFTDFEVARHTAPSPRAEEACTPSQETELRLAQRSRRTNRAVGRTPFGAAGPPPRGAAGPAPQGAPGPPPQGAAGPPPHGAGGPPPMGAAGPPPVGAAGPAPGH